MSKLNKNKTFKLTVTAILAAFTVLVSFLPIKTLGLEITLCTVPITVGAILGGPITGAILGGVFGAVSFLQCLGYSPFGAALLTINPLYTFITCVPTRILAGLVAGFIYKITSKGGYRETLGCTVTSVCMPILNTLFFMSALLIMFWHSDLISGFAQTLGTNSPIVFAVLFVGINGMIEIIVGAVIALPVAKTIKKFAKKYI